MGEIIIGIKIINANAKMQANFNKASPADMAMAISYLEMLKKKVVERFEKSRKTMEDER